MGCLEVAPGTRLANIGSIHFTEALVRM